MTLRILRTFPALELKLAALAMSGAYVRMDTEEQQIEKHTRRITEMQSEVTQLREDTETLMSVADDDSRELSSDEQKQVDENQGRIVNLLGDIERRQSHLEMLRGDIEPEARQSEPDEIEDSDDDESRDNDQRQANRAAPQSNRNRPDRSARRSTQVEVPRQSRELMGFKNAAHFLEDIKEAAHGHRSKTLSTCMNQMNRRMDANASFGEDGAFPIMPDVANDIKKKIDGSADLVGLCSKWTTNSDRHIWHLNEDEPWTNSGGITGEWIDEGDTITESQPRITKKTTDVHKYAIAVPATHEILRNPSQLEQLIRVSVPEKIAEELRAVILDGNGIGKPLGIFQSGLLAVQAKKSGQTAATVVRENIIGMHNLVHPMCRSNPSFRFIANLDVEPQLDELVGADSRPLYLPAQSLATAPHDTLRGRPLVYTPHAKALGEVGDLAGIDFSKYLVVFGENLRQDFSIHVRFLQDRGVFRFIFNVGGTPMWGKKISEPNTSTQRSFAAAIAQRAGGG